MNDTPKALTLNTADGSVLLVVHQGTANIIADALELQYRQLDGNGQWRNHKSRMNTLSALHRTLGDHFFKGDSEYVELPNVD